MTKHSPGPWAYDVETGRVCCAADITSRYGTIATVDSNEADSRLIAAAPELLEALKRALDPLSIGAETLEQMVAVDREARALIRRIEGEE